MMHKIKRLIRDAIEATIFSGAMVGFFTLLFYIGNIQADEVISEHNEEHVAEDAAREYLRSKGCAWTKTTRTQRFRLVPHKDDVIMFGKQWIVKCVEKQDGKAIAIVTWQRPELYTNGTSLALDQIKEYEIYANDELVATAEPEDTRAEIQLNKGGYTFYLRTVGTNNLTSEKSNESQINLR